MALSQIGNGAGEAAPDAGSTRQRVPAVPSAPLAAAPLAAGLRAADDTLLEAIRRGLVPVDPVARLLAGWTAPPVRAVGAPRVAPAPAGRAAH